MTGDGRDGRTVVGTVGTLVGPADLTDGQDVQAGGVERSDEEPLRSERLDDDGVPGAGDVGYGEISSHSVVEALSIAGDVVKVPNRLPGLGDVAVSHLGDGPAPHHSVTIRLEHDVAAGDVHHQHGAPGLLRLVSACPPEAALK